MATLKEHKRQVHEKTKPFFCDQCGKCYTRKDKLVSHINGIHKKIANYKCEHCDKCFTWESSWRQHLKLMHAGDDTEIWQCEQCGYTAKSNGQLKGHYRRQHNHSEIFKCEQVHDGIPCKLFFPVKENLAR